VLTFPTALRIYLALEPVDMRKQFNGLWSLAEERLGEDPRPGGGVRLRQPGPGPDQAAVLGRDRGMGVRQAARSRAASPGRWAAGRTKLSLAPEALTMLLAGIDLKDGCQKAWYERVKGG
jgi:transposase